jgi:hypothetical protein
MSSLRKVSSFAFLLLLVSAALPTSALAQWPLHPVYSYGRFQIGNGLPIPITFLPPPRDRLDIPPTVMFPTSPATVMQGTGSPRSLIISPAVFTAPGNLVNVPVFFANPFVFQVATSFVITWPKAKATFYAGGRTGPSTVTWCPGYPQPKAGFNPACPSPAKGSPKAGLYRYTKTTNQFGGAEVGRLVSGKAIVAFNAGFVAGCPGTPPACLAAFNFAYGAQPQAIGNKFAVVGYSTPAPLIPGVFPVKVTAKGKVTYINTALGGGTGPTNAATSFAGPWTTGMLTVSVTNAAGNPEIFVRTGHDKRNASGVGGIQLISGSVSARTISGPNANRGWITLTIPEPSTALGALGALLALAVCHHGLVRRRSR